MPRGRIESQILMLEDNGYSLISSGARYCGPLTVTKTDEDTDLVIGMVVAYVSLYRPNAGVEYDFHKLKDSATGLICAALA